MTRLYMYVNLHCYDSQWLTQLSPSFRQSFPRSKLLLHWEHRTQLDSERVGTYLHAHHTPLRHYTYKQRGKFAFPVLLDNSVRYEANWE